MLQDHLHDGCNGKSDFKSMVNRGNPHRDQVIDAMLKALQDYFPQPVAGLPKPSVSVASVSERAVGLNNDIVGEFKNDARFGLWFVTFHA